MPPHGRAKLYIAQIIASPFSKCVKSAMRSRSSFSFLKSKFEPQSFSPRGQKTSSTSGTLNPIYRRPATNKFITPSPSDKQSFRPLSRIWCWCCSSKPNRRQKTNQIRNQRRKRKQRIGKNVARKIHSMSQYNNTFSLRWVIVTSYHLLVYH